MYRTAPGAPPLLIMSNMTPIPRHDYRVGVEREGCWEVVLNTDAEVYGGSNFGQTEAWSEPVPAHGKPASLSVALPPLGTIFLRLRES
jgi:1,4-alpha-glucan branching enzyme